MLVLVVGLVLLMTLLEWRMLLPFLPFVSALVLVLGSGSGLVLVLALMLVLDFPLRRLGAQEVALVVSRGCRGCPLAVQVLILLHPLSTNPCHSLRHIMHVKGSFALIPTPQDHSLQRLVDTRTQGILGIE